MDSKTSLELLNLGQVPEFASLDEKALEFMKTKAKLNFGEHDDHKFTEAEIREI